MNEISSSIRLDLELADPLGLVAALSVLDDEFGLTAIDEEFEGLLERVDHDAVESTMAALSPTV